MSRLLILGGGIAGQTAAMHARKKLGSSHEVVVVTPNSKWNWIPSNIWVGVGVMTTGQVTFPLEPVYKKNRYHISPGQSPLDPPRRRRHLPDSFRYS